MGVGHCLTGLEEQPFLPFLDDGELTLDTVLGPPRFFLGALAATAKENDKKLSVTVRCLLACLF